MKTTIMYIAFIFLLIIAFNCNGTVKTEKMTPLSNVLNKNAEPTDSVSLTETQDRLKEIKGYRIYQTFNEYKLQGIGTTNIKSPYVYVRDEKNAIYVIKSNENQIIKYLKKRDYWYIHWKMKNDVDSDCKCGLVQSWDVCERFIFNDTIMDYNYNLDKDNESKKISRLTLAVRVRTEKKEMLLTPLFKIKNLDNPFPELKFFVENYKKIYTPDSYTNYRKSMFIEVGKEIKNDTLYSYKKEGDLTRIQYIKLNSMGEYDIYSPNSTNNTSRLQDMGFR